MPTGLRPPPEQPTSISLTSPSATLSISPNGSAISPPGATRTERSLVRQLFVIADLVDGTRLVIGDQQGSVGCLQDIGRAAEDLLVIQPCAGEDHLLRILAVRPDRNEDNPIAVLLVPVPRTVLGDEDPVLVLSRELVAGVEFHAERRDMVAEVHHRRREFGAFVAHAELRIDDVALVAIGVAEVLAEVGDMIELVARLVVAQPVTGVFAKPEIAGTRIDRAADAVANADCHELSRAVRRVDAPVLRHAGRRQADVARRSERDVEPALAVGHEILPAVRYVRRHVVIDDLWRRRLLEVRFGIVVFVEL